MFGLFRKKTKEPSSAQGRLLPLASDLSDEALVGAVHQVFVGQKPVVAALFLVALENLPVYYSVFSNAAREEKRYAESMDGMVDFVRLAYAEHQGTSDLDEVNRRRWFYLYVAALLDIAHRRARTTPELWHSIADIWVLLMHGARSLRSTLDRTELWKSTEVDFFASVKTEDDGEEFVESVLLPKEIRHHEKLTAWRERDLSPEVREELAKMDKLLKGE